ILAINFQPSYSQNRRKSGKNLTIHYEIFQIIDLDSFWSDLVIIAEILYPYCKILNILQCDNARLIQVIHSIGYLVQFWNNHDNLELSEKILARLEKRWSSWEQPLLILACLLHPGYWTFIGPLMNELGLVACRLYGICVNAAAVERLWS
ncbi:6223_t:CDS:2, partial [Gigaspora rosea]